MRYRTLDSVRGVAAFAVLLHHAVMTFPGGGEDRQGLLENGFRAHDAWLYATPLRLLVSGPAAVLLFFVLSGFVLTLSLKSEKRPNYPAFAVSRFARIWLPFAVAILASAALSSFLAARPVPSTSTWFRLGTWHEPLTIGNIIRHLAMTGTATDLDNPMWSLIHELRISFIFPALVLLTVRCRAWALISSALLTIACILVVGNVSLPTLLVSWVQTGTYIYFFVIGILIAAHADRARARLESLPRVAIAVLWLLALVGLTIAPADTSRVSTLTNGMLLLVSGLAAGLIIALSIIGGRAERLLSARAPRALGRISYSLYLTHIIVIASVVHAFAGRWPLPLAVGVALPLAIIIADLCQRYIEAPSQRIGKLVASYINRRGDTGRMFSRESALISGRKTENIAVSGQLQSANHSTCE